VLRAGAQVGWVSGLHALGGLVLVYLGVVFKFYITASFPLARGWSLGPVLHSIGTLEGVRYQARYLGSSGQDSSCLYIPGIRA
jgi:hypothetical protein